MKRTSLIAAMALVALTTAAYPAELPTYEATGLPISPVQVGVLGAARVHEAVQAPSTISPHQIKVLRPHVRFKTAEAGAR